MDMDVSGPARLVDRCVHCRMRQFVLVSGMCRRCRRPLAEVEVESPLTLPALSSRSVIRQKSRYPILDQLPDVDGTNATHSQPLGWDIAIPLVFYIVRQQAGMSQRDVQDQLGVPRSWISKIENGNCIPNLSSLIRLAQALDISMPKLIRMCEFLVYGIPLEGELGYAGPSANGD